MMQLHGKGKKQKTFCCLGDSSNATCWRMSQFTHSFRLSPGCTAAHKTPSPNRVSSCLLLMSTSQWHYLNQENHDGWFLEGEIGCRGPHLWRWLSLWLAFSTLTSLGSVSKRISTQPGLTSSYSKVWLFFPYNKYLQHSVKEQTWHFPQLSFTVSLHSAICKSSSRFPTSAEQGWVLLFTAQ